VLGLSEEQIIQIFSSVGQVLSFRLVTDSDTGRPKGFGFAEFADTDAAASAVRNLNNHQVMGRDLRVDFSNSSGKDGNTNNYGAGGGQDGAGMAVPHHIPSGAPQSGGLASLPPLPPGSELPPGISCMDAISQTLAALPPSQLLDLLGAMKSFATNDPTHATELLRGAPQLGYAVFQALLLMGLVDTSVLSSVVEQATNASAAQAAPAPRPLQLQAAPYGAYPVAVPTPPVVPVYAPPAPPPVAQPDQTSLLKQVLAMPQAQVDALPPIERGQIMALRAQYGSMMGGY